MFYAPISTTAAEPWTGSIGDSFDAAEAAEQPFFTAPVGSTQGVMGIKVVSAARLALIAGLGACAWLPVAMLVAPLYKG